jgi:F0F1-type ATP synthase assembly protein I
MGYIVFLFAVLGAFGLLMTCVILGMFATCFNLSFICFLAIVVCLGIINIVRHCRLKKDWPSAKVIRLKRD